MEILVFDKEYDVEKNDYLTILENNLSDYNITLVKEFDKAFSLYKKNDFNIILIDFTTKDGKEFLQEVNRLNSLQKIITMGYTLSCSSEMGCDYCVDNFRKRRLIKPIKTVDLYKTISSFSKIDCRYANLFKEPKYLIKELLTRYTYFKYDEENSLIYSIDDDIHELKQLLNLMVDLKTYNIDYTIVDDRNIKII